MTTTQSLAPARAGDDPGPASSAPSAEAGWRYPPIEALLGVVHPRPASLARRRRSWLLHIVTTDPVVALSVAIALAVTVMLALDDPRSAGPTLGLTTAFVVGELLLARLPSAWPVALPLRFGLIFVYVPLAGYTIDPGGGWPVNSLLIPSVALAAAQSSRGLRFVFVLIAILLLVGLLPDGASIDQSRRLIALAMASGVTALGSRRVVASLERSRDRLRRAQVLQRRRSRQLAAVEAVGEILAREGPTPQALDRVMGLLVETFRFEYPSIYIWDGEALRLGAQRNYDAPIETFPTDRGVIGRVARTHVDVFLPDISVDPDYVSADLGVISEIAVPLLAHADFLGVLNVETAGPRRLDADDLATLKIVADRLSVSLALGRDRQKLTERAGLMDSLVSFSRSLGQTLDPEALHHQVAAGAALVVRATRVSLVLRDRETAEYRVVDVAGFPRDLVGYAVAPGEGIAGRAIANRRLVVDDHVEPSTLAPTVAAATGSEAFAAVSVPLLAEGNVFGALTWARADLRPFSDQEREVAGLLASQVALALTNAELHHATELAAVTDGLTGLNNRRYFDAAMAQAEATRKREPEAERPTRSAIMFDLDHFGSINKLHGHQVGDRILKAFADVLRARLRASDVVARYGGEEFVAVLDGTSRIEAMRLAEQIRETFAGVRFALPDGSALGCSVSAGCSALVPSETATALVIERADVGLAMAKASGRNRVVAA